jgi:hypothetical protein
VHVTTKVFGLILARMRYRDAMFIMLLGVIINDRDCPPLDRIAGNSN